MQRLIIGMSQTKLADKMGITFQQIQKYENGKNRVSASRLQQIARTLRVRPEFFFEEAPGTGGKQTFAKETAIIDGFMSSRDGVALSRAFCEIIDAKMRRSIVSLVEHLARL
jgi:transcriptional regulator with XRE-family HTH domain